MWLPDALAVELRAGDQVTHQGNRLAGQKRCGDWPHGARSPGRQLRPARVSRLRNVQRSAATALLLRERPALADPVRRSLRIPRVKHFTHGMLRRDL